MECAQLYGSGNSGSPNALLGQCLDIELTGWRFVRVLRALEGCGHVHGVVDKERLIF